MAVPEAVASTVLSGVYVGGADKELQALQQRFPDEQYDIWEVVSRKVARKMSKHNRNPKARRNRKWLKNVGDGGRLTEEGKNPNDSGSKK